MQFSFYFEYLTKVENENNLFFFSLLFQGERGFPGERGGDGPPGAPGERGPAGPAGGPGESVSLILLIFFSS